MRRKINNNGSIVNIHEGKHYDRAKSDKYKMNISDEIDGRKLNKECSKCGMTLPITAENFYRDKYRPDGFKTKCKSCMKKEYHEKKVKKKEEDEEKLLEFAKEFIKFLKSNPKIRFNLHNSLETIHKKFKYIQRQIYKT